MEKKATMFPKGSKEQELIDEMCAEFENLKPKAMKIIQDYIEKESRKIRKKYRIKWEELKKTKSGRKEK